MAGYILSRKALRNVAGIIGYLHAEANPAIADQIEDCLFSAFSNLAKGSLLGHTRTDLTDRILLFHFVRPYMVVFRRTRQTVHIVQVIHSSRDIAKLL